jgi:uncharacterized protein YggE
MRLRLLLLTLVPFSLQAQAVRDSVLTVSASRPSRVVADRASLYIVVEGTAETAPDAVARVETKLKAVSDAIKGFGTRAEADRPIAYTVGPTPAPNGYPGVATSSTNVARSLIRVQMNRPDQIAQLVAAALAAGASNTSTLTFESSAADSARRARITEVLAIARADAEAMAQALGGHLGALVDASTSGNQGFQQQATINFDSRLFGAQMPAPEVSITTTVTMRYRLVR